MSTPRAESGRTRCRFLVKAIVAVLSLIVLGVLLGGVSHGVSVGHVYDSIPATTRADDKPDASALVTSVSLLRERLAMHYDPDLNLARTNARPISEFFAPRAIGPAGDAAASGLSRMDRFRNLADTGFEVGGQHYTINPHALTRLRASGRRHIDPESLIRSLDTVPTPGTPGSRIFTDPATGTRWIVNNANEVISPRLAGFKG